MGQQLSSEYTLYPQVVWDIEDGNFPDYDAEEVVAGCEELHEAMEGWGADRSVLTASLAGRGPEERYVLSKKYEQMYDKPLYDELVDETDGYYCRVLALLSMPPEDAEAKMLYDAMKGRGARERQIYPIVCARSNKDLSVLKKAYFHYKNKDLVETLSDNLGGDFDELLTVSAQGIEETYDPENVHTEERIAEDVELFHAAGEGSWGTDERTFFRILVISPPEHLRAVNEAYTAAYDVSMKKACTQELQGDAEAAALFLLGIKLGQTAETLAAEIKKTCAGVGTDEHGLMNLVIRLSGLPSLFREVLDAHEEAYEKTVEERIEDEVGGDFKEVLLALIAKVRADTEPEEAEEE